MVLAMQKYGLAVNSCLIIVLTGVVTVILHELGHFVPAYFYGLEPELHHNFVFYDDAIVSPTAQAIIAAAGPVVSLILGIVFLFVSKRKKTKGLFSLLTLWMGLQGLLSFFGYLFIAPFFSYGDTGKVKFLFKSRDGFDIFLRCIWQRRRWNHDLFS